MPSLEIYRVVCVLQRLFCPQKAISYGEWIGLFEFTKWLNLDFESC